MLAAVTVSAACMLFPSTGSADTTTITHCSPAGTVFVGYHKLVYMSYSSTRWRMVTSYYKIEKGGGSPSYKNNANLHMQTGYGTWDWNSPDSLVSDGAQHMLRDHYNKGVLLAYKNSGAYMNAHFIFDRSLGDPACTTPRINFP